MTLHLIRGLPGCGKSTFAKNLNIPNMVHLEADMYFIQNEVYKFDYSLLHEAHNWCFNETESNLIAGNNVVVSNTFVLKAHLNRYLNLAKNLNIEYHVHDLFDSGLSDNQLFQRNLHSVSLETITKMRLQYEKWN